jgi:hypothetical protein
MAGYLKVILPDGVTIAGDPYTALETVPEGSSG